MAQRIETTHGYRLDNLISCGQLAGRTTEELLEALGLKERNEMALINMLFERGYSRFFVWDDERGLIDEWRCVKTKYTPQIVDK